MYSEPMMYFNENNAKFFTDKSGALEITLKNTMGGKVV